MARLNKTQFIELWWGGRLKAGRQLVHDYATGTLPANRLWKKQVSNGLLWAEFHDWITAEYPMIADTFSKQGFCTVFYTVSGSTARYVRTTGGTRGYVARFGKIKEHRNAFEARKAGLASPEVVE
jgi:hypothetical protein